MQPDQPQPWQTAQPQDAPPAWIAQLEPDAQDPAAEPEPEDARPDADSPDFAVPQNFAPPPGWDPPDATLPRADLFAVSGLILGLTSLLLMFVVIIGWVVGWASALVGIPVSIAGIVRTRGRLRRGRGLAVAGLVMSCLTTAGLITLIIIVLT